MYNALVAAGHRPSPEPGWVYVGENDTHYFYQREGLEGLWGAIKSVGKAVGGVVKKVAAPALSVAASFIPGGSIIKAGIDAARNVIRTGTEQQVAQVLNENMTAEQRAALEREWMERRARELAGTAQANMPLLLGVGLLGLLLLNKRRRR